MIKILPRKNEPIQFTELIFGDIQCKFGLFFFVSFFKKQIDFRLIIIIDPSHVSFIQFNNFLFEFEFESFTIDHHHRLFRSSLSFEHTHTKEINVCPELIVCALLKQVNLTKNKKKIKNLQLKQMFELTTCVTRRTRR